MFQQDFLNRIKNALPIVYPTTTLPALGVIPTKEGLDHLFELKKRDNLKIVSIAVAEFKQVTDLVQIPSYLEDFLEMFSPGSITTILEANEQLDSRLGGNWIAIRKVAHPTARDLLEAVGPLTATSANLSGMEVKSHCDEAASALGLPPQAAISELCPGGKPSTLIRCPVFLPLNDGQSLEIVREGVVHSEEVEHKWKALN